MNITLSVIKADIGSVGGHICQSLELLDRVRNTVAEKTIGKHRQGFFGAAMLPTSQLEYTGVMEKLKALDERFVVRRCANGRGT